MHGVDRLAPASALAGARAGGTGSTMGGYGRLSRLRLKHEPFFKAMPAVESP
jgi:hypothetical protein